MRNWPERPACWCRADRTPYDWSARGTDPPGEPSNCSRPCSASRWRTWCGTYGARLSGIPASVDAAASRGSPAMTNPMPLPCVGYQDHDRHDHASTCPGARTFTEAYVWRAVAKGKGSAAPWGKGKFPTPLPRPTFPLRAGADPDDFGLED